MHAGMNTITYNTITKAHPHVQQAATKKCRPIRKDCCLYGCSASLQTPPPSAYCKMDLVTSVLIMTTNPGLRRHWCHTKSTNNLLSCVMCVCCCVVVLAEELAVAIGKGLVLCLLPFFCLDQSLKHRYPFSSPYFSYFLLYRMVFLSENHTV